MVNFFKTEPVKVISFEIERDELGEVVNQKKIEREVEVLVRPASTQDLEVSRPDGTEIVYSLSFPKGWDMSLKGAQIEVRGEVFKVDGDPKSLTVENCPTSFNLTVKVVRADG